jgi:S-adenosylmethionine decarboxylase
MDTSSVHVLVELYGCDADLLNDIAHVEWLLNDAAVVAGATVVGRVAHQFAPQGVTVVVVVKESHLSLHTWPEFGYAAADFFTCGDCSPDKAVGVLIAGLSARRAEILRLARGRPLGCTFDGTTRVTTNVMELPLTKPGEPRRGPPSDARLVTEMVVTAPAGSLVS